jgi:N-acetyl-alpha-D-muramate 1-phosphate uridylyltransferase
MQAVILAGGLATRLGDLASTTPKSLLPVGGRPFLAWQLERLRTSGFADVLLCIGHLGSQIREFAGDGSAFGLQIRYAEDGPVPLGTAGALRAAVAELAPTFLVTYGDSYLPFDYSSPLRDLEAHPDALGTMSVFHNEGRFERSNTAIRSDHVSRYEKGSDDPALDHIDYGALALRRELIEGLPAATAHGLDQLQASLAAAGRLRALLARERFYEIGTPYGLAELDRQLRVLAFHRSARR